MRVTDVTVVVPAHDEEDYLPACLRALAVAAARVPVPVRTVVVLDACADDTARHVPEGVVALQVSVHNVGAARAAGFAHLPAGAGTWFASTDADSCVPENWLVAQLASAREHDLFVGTVRVDDWAGRGGEVAVAHDSAYAHRDGHRHVHGANLGISARAYRGLGGFAPLAVHEDADLVARAETAGLRIDRSAGAPVRTSARVSHRTPDGFSATLDRLGSATAERI